MEKPFNQGGALMKSLGLMVILMAVSTAATALGATFNVTNPTEFQSALTAAAANDDDDVINVAAGTYNITTTLTYFTDDGDGGHTLTIQGAGAAATVLSGGGTTPVMSISTDTGLDGGDAGGNIVIRALTFRDGNNTGSAGGGTNIFSYYANVTCEDSIFTNNTADNGGGALILALYGTVTVTGNTFSSNTSSLASSGGGGGLAAASQYASMTLAGNTFSNNSSASGGGGAVAGGGVSLTASGNVFSGNTALTSDPFGGGAIRASGLDGTILLEGNEFSNNSAPSSHGGGATVLLMGSGSAMVSENSFSDNSSGWDGGGAYVFSVGGGAVSVVRNTFSSNTASGQGGGAAGGTSGMATFVDNVFLGNTADIGGGLVTGPGNAAGITNVVNNTFSENRASTQGGGMAAMLFGELATMNVYNNIFWNNSALSGANDGDDVYVNADIDDNSVGGPVNLFNNDFSGNANFASAQSEDLVVTLLDNYAQGNNIQQDPFFVNAGLGDVHLQSASHCIDKGDNNAPSIPATDFDGGSRIVDGDGNSTAVVDIGADEFGSDASSYAINVPAMDGWGAFLFAVLAGLAAVSRMRRRAGRTSRNEQVNGDV
jgi:hypothetical protein